MRRHNANDRIVSNELTAATVDAPERETYVKANTNPTNPAPLEVGCDAGTVVINGSSVSVNAQSEAVSDLTGTVTETAYAYHTLSVDNTGTLVVRTSDTGEFGASSPNDPPITQVTEPSHAAGECYLGTAFQVEGSIERVFDGRFVISELSNSIITQGEGSGLDADTYHGSDPNTLAGNQLTTGSNPTTLNVEEGEGSGLDADTVRGRTAIKPDGPNDLSSSRFEDTWYQNTTGGPIWLSITRDRGASGNGVSVLHVNDTKTNNEVQREAGSPASTTTWIVPNNYYYKFTKPDILHWHEIALV